jgi:hypothetical protein
MFPRWHILYGALFSLLLKLVAPGVPFLHFLLVFLASVLIDLDHYLACVHKTKKWSLLHAFDYHRLQAASMRSQERRGLKPKSDFHLFHTLEFQALIGLLGIFWLGFFYLFIGMVFHSLLDVIDGVRNKTLHRREYFFFTWLRKRM